MLSEPIQTDRCRCCGTRLGPHDFFCPACQRPCPKGHLVSDDADPRFVALENGLIKDLELGLIWQGDGSDEPLDFGRASLYVHGLNREEPGGNAAWRLPTLKEAASLLTARKNRFGLHINHLFSPRQQLCWTSQKRGDGIVGVLFYPGAVLVNDPEAKAFVRAVREDH